MSNIQKTSGSQLTPAAARALAAYQNARGLAVTVGGNGLAILADCSGSMRSEGAKNQTREGMLRQALSDIWPTLAGAKLIAFAGTVATVESPRNLPRSFGGTNLAAALRTAKGASRILVISDGQPDDEYAALLAAQQCRVPVSVLFVGSPDDAMAKAFMGRLAKETGGRCEAKDLMRLAAPLATTIRGLLPQ